MIATLRTAFAVLAIVAVAACRSSSGEAPGELAASDKSRIVASAPPADLAAAVHGQNDLGFDVYRKLVTGNDNLFFSPLSLSTALSMTYAGAAGTTATAFEDVLGSGISAAAHHRAMNDLDAQLASRGQGAKGADGQPFRLNSTNQLFAANGYSFETPFLDTLAQEYGANVRLLDFESKTEPSRIAINDWVAARTENRIVDLLAPGIIKPDTRLVLVNAIYFNAAWAAPFDEHATAPGAFNKLDGTQKTVDFMHQSDLPTRAAQVNGVEVFELPYDGDELSMLVMMPASGGLAQLETQLTAAQIDSYVAALQAEHLNLKFPKFELRTAANLSTPLKELGLAVAFSDDADFSAMSKAEALAITDVVQQAFVKVNEKGTEAAAATAVIVGPTSVPQTRTLTVDRPFVFAIRDNATGALVFMGRVAEP